VNQKDFYSEVQQMTTKVIASGHIYQTVCMIGRHDKHLEKSFIEELVTYCKASLPSVLKDAMILIFPMGGAVLSGTGVPTSISSSMRSGRYFAIVEVYWKPEAGDAGKDAARAWARTAHALLGKCSTCATCYAGDEVVDRGTILKIENSTGAGAITGYDAEQYTRLGKLKGKYDGENLFQQNTNIKPIV
jgi:hypothetical protein